MKAGAMSMSLRITPSEGEVSRVTYFIEGVADSSSTTAVWCKKDGMVRTKILPTDRRLTSKERRIIAQHYATARVIIREVGGTILLYSSHLPYIKTMNNPRSIRGHLGMTRAILTPILSLANVVVKYISPPNNPLKELP